MMKKILSAVCAVWCVVAASALDAGDLILYQGKSFVIYYDKNSWNFTPLGKLEGISKNELKTLLGKGNVTVVLKTAE